MSIPAYEGAPEPASDDLCKELGINPEDALKLTDSYPTKKRSTVSSSYFTKDRQPKLFEKNEPEPEDTEEPFATVMRTLAEYLADKDPSWWAKPVASRRKEIDFVTDSLINLYDALKDQELL